MGENNLITDHYFEASEKYRKLISPCLYNGMWRIDGIIDVVDDDGCYWDSYDISIVLSKEYPNDLPTLIETGKKIERTADWHISADGQCCLSTRAKMFYDLNGEITLLRWLNQFAHPFLANHVYRKKTKHYANEEFTHGVQGIIEGWKKILQVNTESKVLHHLEYMSGSRTMSKNELCFCGRGKLYKRCFLLNPIEHRLNIPVDEITKDMKAIRTGII